MRRGIIVCRSIAVNSVVCCGQGELFHFGAWGRGTDRMIHIVVGLLVGGSVIPKLEQLVVHVVQFR